MTSGRKFPCPRCGGLHFEEECPAIAAEKEKVAALIEELRSGSDASRARAAETLGRIGDRKTLDMVSAALGGEIDAGRPNEYMNLAFNKILSKPEVRRELDLAHKKSEERYQRFMEKEREADRAKAAVRQAAEPLVAALQHEDDSVRERAIMELTALAESVRGREKTSLRALIGALRDSNPDLRKLAVKALHKLGWKPPRALEQAMYLIAKGLRDNMFEVAALGIAAAEPVKGELRARDPKTRWAAVYALDRIGDSSAIGVLFEALADTDDSVRQEAAGALRKIVEKNPGDARCTTAVTRLVQKLFHEFDHLEDEARQDCRRDRSSIGGQFAIGGQFDVLAYESDRAAFHRTMERAKSEIERAKSEIEERLWDKSRLQGIVHQARRLGIVR